MHQPTMLLFRLLNKKFCACCVIYLFDGLKGERAPMAVLLEAH